MLSKLVIASSNAGKIKELQALLPQFELLPQSAFAIPDAEETASTFVENALIKARHAAKISGLPAIADDSGLVVDALQGAPGIFSARYAGLNASDDDNLQKLLTELKDTPPSARSARFVCALVFLQDADDPLPIIAQGIWEGSILTEPVGDGGFGYDPVFWVPEQRCSSAQFSAAQKNAISHRGLALAQLSQSLK